MTVLEEIVQKKKEAVARAKDFMPEAQLRRMAAERVIYFDFESAVTRQTDGPVRIIAEIKHASPSKGVLTDDFEPVAIGSAYQEAGVDAISVLTEEDYFKGKLGYIDRLRQADVKLPILRKDFIFDSYQVVESAAAGADALLLIVAILDKAALTDLCEAAVELGLAPVVEVFNEKELELALDLRYGAIQINNRDLRDFKVRIENTETLMQSIPAKISRPIISASGFFKRADVERVERAGVDAVLVGESLMRQPDSAAVANKVRELRGS